jgi:peroxiredoxin (alkyl hydroperoxide reductase subunit C)
MSLINTEIKPFTAQAFKGGKFIEVSDADLRGKWSVVFFYTHFSHKAWHDTSPAIGKIQYTMIGDPSGVVTNNFGVMREGQGLADRGTFLVDPQGVIQFTEVTAEGIGRNAAELMRKVKAAQYVAAHPGEVCPAKWEEGEKTLAPSLDLVGKI